MIDEINMDKTTLFEKLNEGIIAYSDSSRNFDRYFLRVDEYRVICTREWMYDDQDMNEDSGSLSAVIRKSEFEDFIKQVLFGISSQKVFNSINSYHSSARYSESPTFSNIDVDNYPGLVCLSLFLDGNNIDYRFVLTKPDINDAPFGIRLEAGKDYLRVG
jgi:hypothetical protein